MHKLEAIIQRFKLEEVTAALLQIGVPGVTLSEVRGFGRQRGHLEIHPGVEYLREFLPKSRLEIVVPDDAVEKVSSVLVQHCRTGRIGDGMIFTTRIGDAIRIRTGEAGEPAVSSV